MPMSFVFEHSAEAIVITDAANRVIATNGAFSRLSGYSREEVLGSDHYLLREGLEGGESYAAVAEALQSGDNWQGEVWGRRKDGSRYPKQLDISVVRDGEGEVCNYVTRFSDLSEQKLAASRIEHLFYHDGLTHLPNRHCLMERLSQSLELAKRAQRNLALLYVDLDRFQAVNALGHGIGDLLLVEVADRLLDAVRSADIVARLGADEFVVVLPALNSGLEAAFIAERVMHGICAPCTLAGHELQVTPSIGISVFPHDGDTVEELFRHADAAMNHAKTLGRNNYQFYKREMHDKARERMMLEHDLRLALTRREMVLHYQPQVEVKTGRILGVEALVRWRHPRRGLVSPAEFIPLAEESGLIIPLGEWVLEEACRQLNRWDDEGLPPIRMAVNLSARQLRQKGVAEAIYGIIAAAGVDPARLELEITESAAMDRAEETVSTMERLKAMGMELAIDDFGTGYSSLSYLKLFPVNSLKIDRAFVKDIESEAGDAAIAAATITLGHTLGKKVVAEGVETREQLAFLSAHRCDVAQGYLFSKPLPAEEFTAFANGCRQEAGAWPQAAA